MHTLPTFRWSLPLCTFVVAAQFACGPRTRHVGVDGEHKVSPAARPARPALEVAQPILRFVPPSSELVVVAPSLDKLVVAVRAFEPIARQLPIAAQWQDALQANLGATTESATWARFGVDVGSALALFSEGTSSTLLVPLVPDAQWQELPAMVLASQSELLSDAQGSVLALRWSLEPGANPQSWIAAMHAAATGDSFAASPRAEDAARFARGYAEPGGDEQKEIWGHYDVGKVLANSGLPCVAIAASLTGVSLQASVLANQVTVHAEAPLAGEGASALRALLGPRASLGMQRLRDEEGLSASLRVDLGAVTNALRRQRCNALSEPLAASLENIGFAPTAIHMAGSRFDASELSGKLAVDLGLVEKRYFTSLLDEIPGRSLFESKITLAGQRLVKLGVPLMSTFYYQLTEHRLLFSTHKDMMTELLAEPSADGELLFLRVVPERLPQLTQMLSMVMPRHEAQALVELVRQFELLQADIQLKDTRLLMEAQLRLVPPRL